VVVVVVVVVVCHYSYGFVFRQYVCYCYAIYLSQSNSFCIFIFNFSADNKVSCLGWMQREAVEALIQELPKFRLKAVPTDCSECPICLEEFRVGNEVYFSKSN
jgi:hypothetical protein